MSARVIAAAENVFAVPPAYCLAWMTDYRQDDARFMGAHEMLTEVRHEGAVIHRRMQTEMGPMVQRVTIDSDTRWSVVGAQLAPDGTELLGFRMIETVAPEGSGTRHRVEIILDRYHPSVEPMLPMIQAGWQKNVDTIFAALRPEIEGAFKSGKPAGE